MTSLASASPASNRAARASAALASARASEAPLSAASILSRAALSSCCSSPTFAPRSSARALLCSASPRSASSSAASAPSCPHDHCWHSWKNATQMPANKRGDYPAALAPQRRDHLVAVGDFAAQPVQLLVQPADLGLEVLELRAHVQPAAGGRAPRCGAEAALGGDRAGFGLRAGGGHGVAGEHRAQLLPQPLVLLPHALDVARPAGRGRVVVGADGGPGWEGRLEARGAGRAARAGGGGGERADHRAELPLLRAAAGAP